MRLDMRTWGSGSRIAVLVHGYTDDSATWWCIGPALADRGYTVLAPDLRGHGTSPRARSYSLADFAADLRDTLPRGADVVLGHSLGALALAACVDDLVPGVAVYVDPPWLRGVSDLTFTRPVVNIAQVRAEAPRWSEEDVVVDVNSTSRMDPQVTRSLLEQLSDRPLPLPAKGTARVHVVVPDEDPLLPLAGQEALQALGYVMHSVRAGHVVHRDDPDALLEVLRLVEAGVVI